jgi:hypothetical protein
VLALAPGGERHGDGRRRDEHEDAGRVRAALRVDAGVEDHRDQEGGRGEHEDERSHGPGPGRRHPVPGKVARHQVEQPGHGRRPGEPEDRDRRDVVHRAERAAEVGVGEVRERAAVGRPARFERRVRDEHGGDDAARDQKDAHDHGGRGEQALGPADPPDRALLGVAAVTLDVRHDGDAGLEAGQAKGELGEHDQRDADHDDRIAMLPRERGRPVTDERRVGDHPVEPVGHHDRVESQVDHHQADGDADRLGEPLEEHPAEQRDQDERDGDLMALEGRRPERVFVDVGGGVGGRQGHGDDEVGRREAEQDEHEEFALPVRQKAHEHRDRALAMRAVGGHAPVDGQRSQQRDQHQDGRRDRRQQAGRERGDARLVAQRGEVVHAGEAHDLPPRVPAVLGRPRVRPAVLHCLL